MWLFRSPYINGGEYGVAVLSNDVCVVLCLENVVEFHDVLAIELSKSVDFIFQKCLMDWLLYHFHIYDLQ